MESRIREKRLGALAEAVKEPSFGIADGKSLLAFLERAFENAPGSIAGTVPVSKDSRVVASVGGYGDCRTLPKRRVSDVVHELFSEFPSGTRIEGAFVSEARRISVSNRDGSLGFSSDEERFLAKSSADRAVRESSEGKDTADAFVAAVKAGKYGR